MMTSLFSERRLHTGGVCGSIGPVPAGIGARACRWPHGHYGSPSSPAERVERHERLRRWRGRTAGIWSVEPWPYLHLGERVRVGRRGRPRRCACEIPWRLLVDNKPSCNWDSGSAS